jgi:hypothetical protein
MFDIAGQMFNESEFAERAYFRPCFHSGYLLLSAADNVVRRPGIIVYSAGTVPAIQVRSSS